MKDSYTLKPIAVRDLKAAQHVMRAATGKEPASIRIHCETFYKAIEGPKYPIRDLAVGTIIEIPMESIDLDNATWDGVWNYAKKEQKKSHP